MREYQQSHTHSLTRKIMSSSCKTTFRTERKNYERAILILWFQQVYNILYCGEISVFFSSVLFKSVNFLKLDFFRFD